MRLSIILHQSTALRNRQIPTLRQLTMWKLPKVKEINETSNQRLRGTPSSNKHLSRATW